MFVAGVSTQKVGDVAQTLIGVAPSAGSVSHLNQTLTKQFEVWRERPLQEHWCILYLDGIHYEVRHGDQTDSTMLLTALGVDLEGNKKVLALCACAEESKEGWMGLLQDIRRSGATRNERVGECVDKCLLSIQALIQMSERNRSWMVFLAFFCPAPT